MPDDIAKGVLLILRARKGSRRQGFGHRRLREGLERALSSKGAVPKSARLRVQFSYRMEGGKA
jgi:hypothetical protein